MTIGLFLLFLGVLFPLLMIIKVLEPTFFLIFFTSASSTVGLATGMIGLTQLSVRSIKKEPHGHESEWSQHE